MTGKPSDGGSNFRQALAGGAAYATAALLLVAAVSSIVQGIAALLDNRVVVITPNYIVAFNMTAWGVIHLVVGSIAAAVAAGLLRGAIWARVAAITTASLSVVSMFLWVAHAPVWSILTIVIDIVIIWALLTWESPRNRGNRETRYQQ